MSTYALSTNYYAGTVGYATLPEGKTWDDIEEWFVKWDTLHFRLKGEPPLTWREIQLNSETMDIIDWKRPLNVEVFAENADADSDEEIDWAEPIDEQEG